MGRLPPPHRALVQQRRRSPFAVAGAWQLLGKTAVVNEDTCGVITRFPPAVLRATTSSQEQHISSLLLQQSPGEPGRCTLPPGSSGWGGAPRPRISHELPGEDGAASMQSTALRLTTETEGWRRTPVPSPPGISAVTSPSPTAPAPHGKQVCHRGRREAEGLTYFLLASWSASDSSNLRASSRNFFMLSFISLFLANSCLILSSKPERKPFLFPEE